MLSGLHQAETYLAQGLTIEQIDALMGAPVGFPSTGLYGLFDLIGLDVMDHVGRNMVANLPEGDRGRVIAAFPTAEQAMLERGQLGRKSGGGFYRVSKQADGGKLKEVFDARANLWRKAEPVQLASHHANLAELALSDDVEGRFTWDLMVGTLLYAADLVPAISDDVVNVDRALRWGYNWGKGPFEMLDEIGPTKVIARLERLGQSVPHMLAVLKAAGADRFYGAGTYLGGDGIFHPVPKE